MLVHAYVYSSRSIGLAGYIPKWLFFWNGMIPYLHVPTISYYTVYRIVSSVAGVSSRFGSDFNSTRMTNAMQLVYWAHNTHKKITRTYALFSFVHIIMAAIYTSIRRDHLLNHVDAT